MGFVPSIGMMRMILAKDLFNHFSDSPDCTMRGRTRIVLVDDNPALLESATQMLKNSYVIVGAFLDGKSVLEEWSTLSPDVVVLDISMGDVSGLEVAESLHTCCSKLKIVFLTIYEDSDFITSAFAAGASAYVFKSRIATDLILAIDRVQSGGMFVSPGR